MRALSYNILNDHPRFAGTPDAWPQRRAAVAARLRAHAPDVAGLQEVTRAQLADLRADLPLACVPGEPSAPHGEAEFCAIFYRADRLDCLGHETFWLSPTPEVRSLAWGARHHRICTLARLRDRQTGAALLVANTHLDHTSAEARQRGARLIAARLRGAPAAILMGDFNASPASPAGQIVAAEGGLRLAPLGAGGPPHTFVGLDARWSWRRLGLWLGYRAFMHQQLDHIWCSAGITVERAWADATVRGGGRSYPSDHLPVIADLRLR